LDKAVLGTNKQLIGVIHQARRVALDYSSGRTTICAWLARESIGPADKLDADQQPAMTFGTSNRAWKIVNALPMRADRHA